MKNKLTYTRENVLEAMLIEGEKSRGCAITKDSGEITEDCELKGKKWANVHAAFARNNVARVPERTTMTIFTNFYRRELKLNHPLRQSRVMRKSSTDVFNSVAWEMLHLERIKENKDGFDAGIDITDSELSRETLRDTYARFGALTGFDKDGDRSELLSWAQIVDGAQSENWADYRYISGFGSDFDLAVYATNIQDRIFDGNYKCPDWFELEKWFQKKPYI